MDLRQDDDPGRGHGNDERERSRRRRQQQQQPSTSTTTTGSTNSPATHGQFMGDEFRSYMSRKIELQRKQFGLVLPPAPESSPNTRTGMARKDEAAIAPPAAAVAASSPPPPSSSRKKARLSETSPSSTDAQFSIQSSSSNNTAGSSGLSGVLSRLQKKHGRGSFEVEARMRDVQSTTPRKRRRRREERAGREHDNQDSTGNDCTAVNVSKSTSSSSSAMKSAGDDVLVSAAYRDEPAAPYTKESKTAAKSPTIDEHHLAVTKRSRPDLYFLGVVVLINGYTSPDAPTLTRMLQKHGGDVEKYETSRVTHIIASALSTAKALIYKRQRNPTPYVRPEWIVDSCKEGRLLPYAEYLLDEIRDDSVGKKTVKSFFAASTSEKSKSPTGLESDTGQEIEAGVVRRRLHDDPSIMTRGTSSNDADGESPCSHRIPARPSRPVRTVGSDPDFLDSYFRNSRLSFIGSFKQRVKSTGEASSSPARRRPANTTNVDERYVFHVDIDCFFAAVALRRYPEYRNKPVAIGHGWKTDSHGRPVPVSEGHAPEAGGKERSKKSYSELSTCNYKAREFGVKKGMFLHQAKLLCPDLIVLPYDYEGYEDVSSLVADILHDQAEKFGGAVEQVSCDEAYIEIYLSKEDAENGGHHGDLSKFVEEVAEKIRSDIYDATQCTASVGVAANKFLAKLATDKAKPDGSFIVQDCYSLLYGLKLRDLPGIGWKLDRKLRANNLETVRDILSLGDDAERRLCSLLGTGNGQKILNYIDGKDDRPVQAVQRKTIGAEASCFFAELS